MFGFIPPINYKGNEPIICVELYSHLYYLFPISVEVKSQPASQSFSQRLAGFYSVYSFYKYTFIVLVVLCAVLFLCW